MNEKTQKMRKTNMKIFPIYKILAWDFLFFYTIDFLFLTQVKGISASDVVLKSTIYALFSIIMQIPANVIVEFLGRKNSAILGNVLNCLYIIIIMLSRSLRDLIFAEFVEAIAFSIKNIAEPSLLNESIPPSRYKSEIYSKISSKGASGYYMINAISKIIAGYLFTVNPYIPIILSLAVLVIAVILSVGFIEPVNKNRKNVNEVLGKSQLKDMKEGFSFVLKSERLKALILCAALIVSLASVLTNYYVSLFEELSVSAMIIGVIAALGSLLSAYSSKKQNFLQTKLKNKTLITIAIILSCSTVISGICAVKSKALIIISIVVIMFLIYNLVMGIYYTSMDRYLRNFTNEKIDTKIFTISNLFVSIARVLAGLFASFLLGKTTTAYSILIVGVIYTILYILISKYMNKRVGLRPEDYSEIETKYDEQKKEI